MGYCATRWRELGEALGIEGYKLDIINVNHRHCCRERCKVMLEEWVKQDLSATWSKLLDAIKAIHSIPPADANAREDISALSHTLSGTVDTIHRTIPANVEIWSTFEMSMSLSNMHLTLCKRPDSASLAAVIT